MNGFEKKYGTVEEHEARAKLICEGKDGTGGVFQKLDLLLLNIAYGGRPPYYEEDLLNHEPVLRDEFRNEYTYEVRRRAMYIYRAAMNVIYCRYEVDTNKSIAHIEFRSALSEPKPASFMGVRYMGQQDEGDILLKVEHFGKQGIGFVERHSYTKKEDTGIGVISTPGQLAYVGHPYSNNPTDHNRAVPYDFSLSAYELRDGKIQDDLY